MRQLTDTQLALAVAGTMNRLRTAALEDSLSGTSPGQQLAKLYTNNTNLASALFPASRYVYLLLWTCTMSPIPSALLLAADDTAARAEANREVQPDAPAWAAERMLDALEQSALLDVCTRTLLAMPAPRLSSLAPSQRPTGAVSSTSSGHPFRIWQGDHFSMMLLCSLTCVMHAPTLLATFTGALASPSRIGEVETGRALTPHATRAARLLLVPSVQHFNWCLLERFVLDLQPHGSRTAAGGAGGIGSAAASSSRGSGPSSSRISGSSGCRTSCGDPLLDDLDVHGFLRDTCKTMSPPDEVAAAQGSGSRSYRDAEALLDEDWALAAQLQPCTLVLYNLLRIGMGQERLAAVAAWPQQQQQQQLGGGAAAALAPSAPEQMETLRRLTQGLCERFRQQGRPLSSHILSVDFVSFGCPIVGRMLVQMPPENGDACAPAGLEALAWLAAAAVDNCERTRALGWREDEHRQGYVGAAGALHYMLVVMNKFAVTADSRLRHEYSRVASSLRAPDVARRLLRAGFIRTLDRAIRLGGQLPHVDNALARISLQALQTLHRLLPWGLTYMLEAARRDGSAAVAAAVHELAGAQLTCAKLLHAFSGQLEANPPTRFTDTVFSGDSNADLQKPTLCTNMACNVVLIFARASLELLRGLPPAAPALAFVPAGDGGGGCGEKADVAEAALPLRGAAAAAIRAAVRAYRLLLETYLRVGPDCSTTCFQLGCPLLRLLAAPPVPWLAAPQDLLPARPARLLAALCTWLGTVATGASAYATVQQGGSLEGTPDAVARDVLGALLALAAREDFAPDVLAWLRKPAAAARAGGGGGRGGGGYSRGSTQGALVSGAAALLSFVRKYDMEAEEALLARLLEAAAAANAPSAPGAAAGSAGDAAKGAGSAEGVRVEPAAAAVAAFRQRAQALLAKWRRTADSAAPCLQAAAEEVCVQLEAPRTCAHVGCTNFAHPGEAQLQLRRCGGCGAVRYCCADCQRADWAAGHKELCRKRGD